jgi:single-stranded-DNA-specific exonuclease
MALARASDASADRLSVTGKRWVLAAAPEREALAIAQRHRLPDTVARILAARGIALDAVPGFLEPRLRDELPDPSRFKDMDKAADRLVAALKSGERIAVFADYDVDGASSGALLARFLRQAGQMPILYVPDRMAEGYGPKPAAMEKLAEQGARLLIAADCGTSAHEALDHAKALGMEVIVLDHHAAEPKLPAVHALVNPNRLDEEPGFGHLAAAGVTFMFLIAANRALRRAGYYAEKGLAEPDLMDSLDLAALGTVCDVVPLTGLNRALVAQGLKVMARRGNPGIAALCGLAGQEGEIEAWHLGFLLGPRINAGGRVGASDMGLRLLCREEGGPEAVAMAESLERWNAERQEIEAIVLEAALGQFDGLDAETAPPVLVAKGEGWHPGVIGIVASRLKEKFNRPGFVVAIDTETGLAKASGRSIREVDLGAAIISARQAGLLVDGGGHAMAGGFTVEAAKLPELELFLAERIGAGLSPEALIPRLTVDALLAPGGATLELVEMVSRLGPFGAGNPEPRFVLRQARLVQARAVGAAQTHVSCQIADMSGRGERLKGIAFRAMDSALGKALLEAGPRPLDLLGTLTRDSWQGVDRPQIQISDAAYSA